MQVTHFRLCLWPLRYMAVSVCHCITYWNILSCNSLHHTKIYTPVFFKYLHGEMLKIFSCAHLSATEHKQPKGQYKLVLHSHFVACCNSTVMLLCKVYMGLYTKLWRVCAQNMVQVFLPHQLVGTSSPWCHCWHWKWSSWAWAAGPGLGTLCHAPEVKYEVVHLELTAKQS